MPKWSPPSEIGLKELVGRRLFDKVGTERATESDETPTYKVDDFYDDDESSDLSIDRLGDQNPQKSTLKAVTELADGEAAKRAPPRQFNGWASILVQNLKFRGWSPLFAITDTETNPWHAEVSRDGFRARAQAYALAAALRDTFERKGRYQPPVRI